MKFEIDFNRELDDITLQKIGAHIDEENTEYTNYCVELNTFEELEKLLERVYVEKKTYYSAVISFDSPCIYLDKDI